MKNKKLIIVVGLIAVASAGLYFWNRNRKKSETGIESSSDEISTEVISGNEIPQTKASGTTTSSTGIKGLRGKDRREFRKDTRDICAEKYGKGKDYRQCKNRVKKGQAAFTGEFDDFRNDYIDFTGLNLDL